jgi:hypothetical protein
MRPLIYVCPRTGLSVQARPLSIQTNVRLDGPASFMHPPRNRR